MKLVNGKRSQLLEYLMIIAGTGLMALAINSVFDASGMVTGGFSGIAIIIKAGSQGIIDGGIPLWVTNMGLNIPLFLIGWKINGFSFVKKALIGEIALSTWLAIEPVWNLAGNDLLLAALYRICKCSSACICKNLRTSDPSKCHSGTCSGIMRCHE